MITAQDRIAETLLPIIQKYILPGTTIISDGWSAYKRIGELSERYIHMVIKHSGNYWTLNPVQIRIMWNLSGKNLKWKISNMEQEERFLNLSFLSMYGVNYLVEMILYLICDLKC
jgi:hypothetical protein